MITMRIDKSMFFDRPKVMRTMDKANRQALSRAGAFIRQRARSSIRKRKRPAPPGRPPHAHEGSLRRYLIFGYDRNRGSVVIGPRATNQIFFDRDRKPVKGTIPQVLEHGGRITILEVQTSRGWMRASLRSRRRLSGRKLRYRTVTIRARPYMGPALEKERSNLPRAWRNSVRSG